MQGIQQSEGLGFCRGLSFRLDKKARKEKETRQKELTQSILYLKLFNYF